MVFKGKVKKINYLTQVERRISTICSANLNKNKETTINE